jgi:hypothetical protein
LAADIHAAPMRRKSDRKEKRMALDRSTVDALEDEVRALGSKVSDLSGYIATMTADGARSGRDAAYLAGREVVRIGGDAGGVARRHPAATGLALLAVAGAIICFTLLTDRPTGRRRR